MRAQAHAAGVRDAHAGGHHVVDHARELVDPVHGERAALARHVPLDALDGLDRDGAAVGPRDVLQVAEDAVQVHAAGKHQAVRQQVQAQVGVRTVGRRGVRVDDDADGPQGDGTIGVRVNRGGDRRCITGHGVTEAEPAEAHVEDGAVRVEGGDAGAPCSCHV